MSVDARANPTTFWSSSDILRHYGISRPTLQRWRAKPGFPAPLKEYGGRGFLWDRAEVVAWKKVRDAPQKSRKASAIHSYIAYGRSIRETARRHRIPASTLRGWLIETGNLDNRKEHPMHREVVAGPAGHWYALLEGELHGRPMEADEDTANPPPHPLENHDGWYPIDDPAPDVNVTAITEALRVPS